MRPWLATDLLVEKMKRYSAQGLRYLETQAGVGGFIDHDGKPIDIERGVQFFRDALNRPDAKATGMTVRFLLTLIRFAPNAEEQVERAYAFVDGHRDLWVSVNMAGGITKGHPLRFLERFRKMRRTYSGIQLSIHAGEVDSPGQDVRRTLMLGADTGDEPGEFQNWVEREKLDRVYPVPQGYHDLRMNRRGVLGVVIGIGTAKAAATITALGLDPFDSPNARRPPLVLKGETLSSMTFWHGKLSDEWANDWVKYQTDGKGNSVTSAMEDT